MTEDEFRARFNADRRANDLSWVADEDQFGIAVGLRGPMIVLHGGSEIALANARFIGAAPEDRPLG